MHLPWKQNLVFSIRPQMQMKHVHSRRSRPWPDPRCRLEKAPASSSVGAHQGSMLNAENIQEILPPTAFIGSVPTPLPENSIKGWGREPGPRPPAEPGAIAMQTTVSLDCPDCPDPFGNDFFTIRCLLVTALPHLLPRHHGENHAPAQPRRDQPECQPHSAPSSSCPGGTKDSS